jgi:hypothetical protein
MTAEVMRLPGVPTPYPDELLYSVFARAGRYLGITSPKRLTATLLGSRGALAVPDLPSRLGCVEPWARSEWGLSLENIVLGHTAAPYYLHLRGRRAYRAAVVAMRGTGRHLQVRLGLCTSIVRDTDYFRLCPDCVREDLRRLGETYWRRCHQLPGVLVCPEHGTPLSITSVPFRGPSRHEFAAAAASLIRPAEGQRVFGPAALRIARDLAGRSAAWCDLAPAGDGALVDYRPTLRRHRYVGERGAVIRLQRDLGAFVGERLLGQILRPGVDPVAWIAAAARKPRRHLHPVQHLLLRLLIEQLPGHASVEPVELAPHLTHRWKSREPALREEAAKLAAIGYRPYAIARTLGVAWQTAARLVAPLAPLEQRAKADVRKEKSVWLALTADNPGLTRSELRRLVPDVYARLYRADRAWLMNHGPIARQVRRARSRVDWRVRDEQLAADIRATAESLLNEVPPVRVSASRVLGELHARTTLARRSAKLPKSRAALRECCETTEAYQIRRAAHVMRSARRAGAVPAWLVFRRAGIDPRRFSDNGQGILARARRLEAGIVA